jgi:hypothetical protein
MDVTSELDRQQIRAWIESDDELRTLPFDRLSEAVGKVRRRHDGHVLRLLPPKDGEGRFFV